MSNANVFGILALIALVLMFFTQTATGHVNQFAPVGMSFSYPADWPDLKNFTDRQITGKRIELYMDQWRAGFVDDLNNAWRIYP